jgi:phosphopantothenoylcysteine decarboxylase/phosphopantothenate--cysteine ligase
MTKIIDDLTVYAHSDALKDKTIDLVVSGSIAAVEAVRFARALRRLGANVIPWLTKGGSQFVTPMALEWAAAHPCIENFSGTASHICTSDAVVIAPASSNIISDLVNGSTGTPSLALTSSALGQKKPVIILPAMHDSLANAPSHLQHLETLRNWDGVSILSSREEEGKRKFPEPAVLADQISHILNRATRPAKPVLVTMGTTRGYIDDVRYVSNYSSGKLGSLICDELYRSGYLTHVVCGPCEFKPQNTSVIKDILTTQELLTECKQAESSGLAAAVFCASVLDFEPTEKSSGKLKSTKSELLVRLVPTPKIIQAIDLKGKPKIGFKLETGLTETTAREVAVEYLKKHSLTALIANNLSEVSKSTHFAWAFDSKLTPTVCRSKIEIAGWIKDHIS